MHKRVDIISRDNMQPLVLTIQQVGQLLGVKRSKVYDLIRREGLPAMKLGQGDMRVSRASLQSWIEQQEERSGCR